MATLGVRMKAAVKAFKQPDLISQPPDAADFCAFEARLLRYALYWAYFENTAYENVQPFARSMKVSMGLYRYTRGVYNPAKRLGEIWQTFLMGGLLDPDAGDGRGKPSALPIVVGETAQGVEDQLRASIAQLWDHSNWQVKKDVLTLQGTVKGDVGLEVVDDVDRGRVYLRVVQPETLAEVTVDAYGHVKGYVIEEERPDPTKRRGVTAVYREEVTRAGDNVVYRTFKDGKPFAWYDAGDGEAGRPARGDEWAIPYTFVPMVMVQHNDVGLDWGWSELHGERAKVAEADDLASKLSDQIRKAIEGAWLFTGMADPAAKGKAAPAATSADSQSYQATSAAVNRPHPGREEVAAFYTTNPAAGAQSLVTPLDIPGAIAHVEAILEELERDLPELAADIWTASGEASGRALRVARQRAEIKARKRRAGYDGALVRAHQMALAIGGWRGYEGYEAFSLDSYGAGLLDHTIGNRPVFAQDPLDEIEVKTAFWTAAETAARAGIGLEAFLHDQGWTEEQIDELVRRNEASPEIQMKREQQQLALQAMKAQPQDRTGQRPGQRGGDDGD